MNHTRTIRIYIIAMTVFLIFLGVVIAFVAR